MARPPKGKPLTFRPLRLDDDVWAECQRLGKEHGTINEGLRSQLLPESVPEFRTTKEAMEYAHRNKIPTVIPARTLDADKYNQQQQEVRRARRLLMQRRSVKRGPRQKGDKTR